MSDNDRRSAGAVMALLGVIGLCIIGGAVWDAASMDTRRWVVAISGAVLFFVMLCAGSDIAFGGKKDE